MKPPADSAAPGPVAPPATAVASAEKPDACIARLAELDVEAVPAPAEPRPPDPLCVVAVPVVVVSIGRKRLPTPVVMTGRPELDCSAAQVFGRFVHEIAAPLAKGTMGTSLASVIAGGYQCRSVNHLPNGHVSPHATGIALDIMSFRFGDGRTIEVGKSPDVAADAYVRAVRTAACGYFTTVLGPGANADHANHLHFDIMHHGVGGDDHWRICQ